VSFPAHGVIITAAGSSSRFNSSDNNRVKKKKEFMPLNDRSVLYHATAPFFSLPGLQIVVVTYAEGYRDEAEVALNNLLFASPVPVLLVQGGETRQQSVLLGLETLAAQAPDVRYALIHDGARPWITEQTIISTLAIATVFGGAAPVLPIHDSVKMIDREGKIVSHVDRNGMATVQTPQIFRFPEILEAHRRAATNGKTYLDDTEIFMDFGGFVGTSEGDLQNRKITVAQDIPDSEEPS
jgi:2-C-methyl-D-erythritol 4-phosphate cytidylyltransferase